MVDKTALLYPSLLDIVVICKGSTDGYHPLCYQGTTVSRLPLCGRPLLSYCLDPFLKCGYKRFFICHSPGDSPLDEAFVRKFHDVQFVSVEVHVREWSDCDALVEFLRVARELREKEGFVRDVLMVNCDTILTPEDIEPFVTNFYFSFQSVALLLWEAPHPPSGSSAGGGGAREGKGTRKAAGRGAGQAPPPAIPVNKCLVILEDEKGSLEIGSSIRPEHFMVRESGAGPQEVPLITHRRLHSIFHSDDAPEDALHLNVGFTARRPSVEFTYCLEDARVYIMQHWVLSFVKEQVAAQSADFEGGSQSPSHDDGVGEDEESDTERLSFERDILSSLALSQFYKIGHCSEEAAVDDNSFVGDDSSLTEKRGALKECVRSPQELLQTVIELAPQWSRAGGFARDAFLSGPLAQRSTMCYEPFLNSMEDAAPPHWDVLRVTATIIKEPPLSKRNLITLRGKEGMLRASYDLTECLEKRPILPENFENYLIPSSPLYDAYERFMRATSILQCDTAAICASFVFSTVPERARFKRSVVGEHVSFNCSGSITIVNSVVMDHVTFVCTCEDSAEAQEGSVRRRSCTDILIQNSIIGANARIDEGAVLINSFVGTGEEVPAGEHEDAQFPKY